MPSAKAFAVVLAVALAASVTALRNGFVYDDVPVVRDDARLRALGDVPHLLTQPYWSADFADRIYRPLTTASFALDWAVGRGSPAVFHAVNVALHLAVTALVLLLAGTVLSRGAVVAALWFAVQPVHVEAFAPVVGRSELLAALGYLAAVLAYAAESRASDDGSPRARAALSLTVLAGAAVAFASKEHALTLPAMLLLADAWTARREGRGVAVVFRGHALLWCGVVALGAVYLAARAAVLGTALGGGNVAPGLGDLTWLQRGWVMLPAFLVWARLLVAPLHLSVDYSPDQFIPGLSVDVAHVAGLLLVAALAAGAWRLRRRVPGVTVGVLWFAVTAAVAANVLVPTGVLVGERLLYLPSVGAALVLGALWERLPRHAAVWPATALVLAALAARSLERIPIWRDDTRFLAARVADAPRSFRTHWELGSRAFDRGDASTGERELLVAARMQPDDGQLLEEISRRYLAAGVLERADRFATLAYRLEPGRDGAAAQAIVARMRMGALDSAAALARLAFRPSPPPTDALVLAAIGAYDRRNELTHMLAAARRGAVLYPENAAFPTIAADAARRLGRCAEARARLARAFALVGNEAARAEIRRREAALAGCREAS